VVVSQDAPRTFEVTENGQKKEIKSVDVVLTDGLNNFLCSAYDREAQRLIDKPLTQGAWVQADMGFSVKTVKGEKGERTFQSIRLRNFYAL
ncbi:MAG: hypothetical protein IKX52_03940, partial [Clostridia bacterium]|nr:hypothetical protein [Clostridia bacterium]